ncbi:uncharacterized protein EKO05_0002381 [Ascochyta rabiei]|uniref:uncharacterized protein n=1 Tax=Didymella rabiei TaxID=5454 RepID=UPI0019022E13|nr:uncharacterized protein EKO05_0002381 [Ascochyta rabiei]UPX11793.1 hypothetical protein EKO05_0002381 [Ascochyta rabiei]
MAEWDNTTTTTTTTTPLDANEARLRAAESLGYPVTRQGTPNPDTNTKKHDHASSTRPQSYDSWLLEKRVRIRSGWADEDGDRNGDVGDSCCFGTRTVHGGLYWGWELHGGAV